MQFAAHDTFHIRDGWLHKGLSAVRSKPEIFNQQHATDHLGIGKNMVESLHYWMNALGIAYDEKRMSKKQAEESASVTVLSDLGKILYEYDKFIEEDVSLWTLHYQLATNKKKATAWYWLFNKLPAQRFDVNNCLNYLIRWVEQDEEVKKKPNLSSLQKDISCVLRTYTKAHGKRRSDFSPEDSFECPFASLQLVDYLENSDSYKMNTGKRMLPVHAFAYAVLRYMKQNSANSLSEVGFQDLLSAENSPGRIFLLSSESLLQNIDALVEEFPKYFSFSKTAGLNTLRLRKTETEALDLLILAYEEMEN